MPSQDELKKAAAQAALKEVKPDTIIGIGTGSTVNFFIALLAEQKHNIIGAVSSSHASSAKLKEHGINIVDINEGPISVYIDGADECNHHCQLIKGGGGALTGEKIIAAIAQKFVCIIDKSKYVQQLGQFPLPIEVIPMARSYVARELVKLGGDPVYREGFTTDSGNQILDVYNLNIMTPIALEQSINNITGVVTNGLFALRGADKVLIATESGIEILTPR
ncbi:MAG: ribose-5-phosphate isomerase RpiA [Proteobacteria bacterium]|nr:ribose-5-phosphate isomerase RpiA [Pseudomonadota bacterium]